MVILMLEVQQFEQSKAHKKFIQENNIKLLESEEADNTIIGKITHFSFQFHGEHCTECAAPDCHKSCDLFSKGPTGRCRRFLDGIILKKDAHNPAKYTMDIIFKPWGRLLAIGNNYCISKERYTIWYSPIVYLSYVWQKIKCLFSFLPENTYWKVSDKITGLGNKLPSLFNKLAKKNHTSAANCLFLQIGNPNPEPILAEIIISEIPPTGKNYRRSFSMHPGWQTKVFPINEIEPLVDLTKLFRITFVPTVSKPTYLQLMYYGFTILPKKDLNNHASSINSTHQHSLKLLIIDLDNTLWKGVLIEDIEKTRPIKSGLESVLRTLDQRGILLSIASKNNYDDAKKALEKIGVWDLFLHPQINWEPKSTNIRTIVSEINIGMNTVGFIDDSIFEREEVSKSLPEIRVYSDTDFINLVNKSEFNPIVTAEAKNRRLYYQAETYRKHKVEKQETNYDDFLASCEMEMILSDVNGSNLDRVFELVQRTNQLNFSGIKYSRDDVSFLIQKEDTIPLVISCHDKYGDYGIVGFVLLSYKIPSLVIEDMMLSCRILGKKVEQAILFYIIQQAKTFSYENCYCIFNLTARNTPAKNVLADVGVEFITNQKFVDLFNSKIKDNQLESLPLNIVDNTNTSTILTKNNAR